MARASYIYVVIAYDDLVVTAFTVKREAMEFGARQSAWFRDHHRLERFLDGGTLWGAQRSAPPAGVGMEWADGY